MTHLEQFVAQILEGGKDKLVALLRSSGEETRRRLDGIDDLVTTATALFSARLAQLCVDALALEAESIAATCGCGRRAQRSTKKVRMRLRHGEVRFPVTTYRCRKCGTNRSPVREWMGLASGMTSSRFDRCLVALSAEMSFGAAAEQLAEQHGHKVDRTLVERRTYAIGNDAKEFLAERREAAFEAELTREGVHEGEDRIIVQADGGAVHVGTLTRPPPEECTDRTPVRQLPRGRRPRTKREVRACVARVEGQTTRLVDVHVAPLGEPEYSGKRLYALALQSGMGRSTHLHMVCDMGNWLAPQFHEQFGAQKKSSLCGDYQHTRCYVTEAGRTHVSDESERASWNAVQLGRLLAGDRKAILSELEPHKCDGRCAKTDRGDCTVVAARRYLRNHGQYMDYPKFIEMGLPIASGEIEGAIRHLVRRRLDIPGSWNEDHIEHLGAIISIIESGLWNAFWTWRDNRDRERYRARLHGEGLNKFRGKARERATRTGTATETFDSPGEELHH